MAKKILQNYDFHGNQIIHVRMENLTSFPAGGRGGRLVFNTSLDRLGYDDGTNFQDIAVLNSPVFRGNPTAPTQVQGNNSTRLATTAFVQGAVSSSGGGDMLRATYDTNGDGTVNAADTATTAGSVPWTGVTMTPTTLGGYGITDALSLAAAGVLATRDTVGAAQIDDGSVLSQKLAAISSSTLMGRVSASPGPVEILDRNQVKSMLQIDTSDVSGLVTALAGKAGISHTHTASQISDLTTAINTQIVAYWDTIAGTDSNVDTIRETLDLILRNAGDLQDQIGRHNSRIGDGGATSFTVVHNLNSSDVTVEVYEVATGTTVGVGVTRTNANTVTISAVPAPALDSLAVVIKK